MVRAIRLGVVALVLCATLTAPLWLGTRGLVPDFTVISAAPSLSHPFGTDALGRDLLGRSLQGLSLSLRIAGFATLVSGLLGLCVALASTLSRRADAVAGFITDAALAVPHLLLLILLAFAFGGGATGLVGALALSHWPRLSRIMRAEAMAIAHRPFVEAAQAFGHGPLHVATRHILPLLWPQWLVGVTLLLPHAVLHEAALTFAGFGPDPGTPALGVMLAEGMRVIAAGQIIPALGPGAVLLGLVLVVESGGRVLQAALRGRS